jgi:hypothetical protein
MSITTDELEKRIKALEVRMHVLVTGVDRVLSGEIELPDAKPFLREVIWSLPVVTGDAIDEAEMLLRHLYDTFDIRSDPPSHYRLNKWLAAYGWRIKKGEIE